MNDEQRRRWLYWALVAAVPTGLLIYAIAQFMLNHFFARPPYLLDTGMLSALSYRNGLILPAPEVALDYVDYYYDVYFSPLTSLFSLVSYIVPIGRLEWYVIIQALVYAPIAGGVYYVASRLEPESQMRRLPLTMLAALAFAFSGPVFWMVGYPHFEAAMPGFTCLALAAVLTGRTRWAWAWLIFAASVRQDGGIHVATALLPVLFLHWRGVPMVPTRRTLLWMIGVAIGTSVLGNLVIKVFFEPIPRLQAAYIGDPLYSHLSVDLVVERLRLFIANTKLLYYPFVATCLIAVLRRDARYLLGWASTLPWFLFCLFAVETMKATFFGYGVGPFLVGIFWVYLYGAYLAPAPRRLRAGVLEVAFILVCLASTLGVHRTNPAALKYLAIDMTIPRPRDRAAVHAFVDLLRDHRSDFGRLIVDGPVATLALEQLQPNEVWRAAPKHVDTIAFHRESYEARPMVPYLIDKQIDRCSWLHGTELVVCSHNPLPALTAIGGRPVPLPFSELVLSIKARKIVTLEDRGVVFRAPMTVRGWLGELAPGTYEWTMTVTTDQQVADDAELARLTIAGVDPVEVATATGQARQITQRFDVSENESVWFSLGVRVAPLVFTDVKVRRVEP